jgi:hypothetical protein
MQNEILKREAGNNLNVQILHQHIQNLRAPFTTPYPLQQRRHLARLDPLQDLGDGLEVCILHGVVASVRRALQRASQRPLGIAAAQQLAHLLADAGDLGLGDGGEGGVERRGVEVGRGFRVQGVDVYGAPVLGQRGIAVVLDDGHCGDWELEIGMRAEGDR